MKQEAAHVSVAGGAGPRGEHACPIFTELTTKFYVVVSWSVEQNGV